jgi:hypothetical protein
VELRSDMADKVGHDLQFRRLPIDPCCRNAKAQHVAYGKAFASRHGSRRCDLLLALGGVALGGAIGATGMPGFQQQGIVDPEAYQSSNMPSARQSIPTLQYR